MTMNISADLQSLFTWNTKQVFVFLAAEYETPQNSLNQVSLWDGIIPAKEHAKFYIHTTNKYRFVDQGSNLRGRDFNLTLHWHVMPKTGKMFADKIVMTGFYLPQSYRAVTSFEIEISIAKSGHKISTEFNVDANMFLAVSIRDLSLKGLKGDGASNCLRGPT
ncbi:hypothetical protein E3N88_33335 [Mikania micrantha]|uniref:Signal peptidase complex subunit 3 n=1 Tax=Mikania micrantha TaxID=192012 RepID=A0A5N6MB42_9ASTR|nr:hypothetical protein E3N88_33335 [Mikania micrantha]